MGEARKEAKEQRTKLLSLVQVAWEISTIKENKSKSLSFFTKAREQRLNQEILTRQLVIEIQLLKDRERTIDRELASVKKELASVKVENASLQWSRGGKGCRHGAQGGVLVSAAQCFASCAFRGDCLLRTPETVDRACWVDECTNFGRPENDG